MCNNILMECAWCGLLIEKHTRKWILPSEKGFDLEIGDSLWFTVIFSILNKAIFLCHR